MRESMGEDTLFMRRKRARFRSWHRGTREADLLIGSFADEHLDGFAPEQLDRFEALLEEVDADLVDWITGRSAVENLRTRGRALPGGRLSRIRSTAYCTSTAARSTFRP
jgi:antitoxin CptB